MTLAPTVMQLCSNALRGMIVAPPGRKIVVSDLSNIEGRKIAWLAGEEWKLQAFRDFDAGTGLDLYILAYARSFGVDPSTVVTAQRQIGKVMELALGYEGGVGALVSMVATYGLDLDELAAAVWAVGISERHLESAKYMWDWASERKLTYGLSERVYIACDVLKQLWREAHSAFSKRCQHKCSDPCSHSGVWKNYEKAFREATRNPGRIYKAGRCKFVRTGNWLRIRLPSGRELCYASPRVADDGSLSYMGINPYTKRWQRLKTYSGKCSENITQASARDVLKRAELRVLEAGYKIVLPVHDELVTEAPDSPEFNAEHLSALLAQGESWTAGLPIAAAGFEAYRYRKDG